MDLNLVVLSGTAMASVTVKQSGSGNRQGRLLVNVKSTTPRHRTDMVPVTFWRDDIGPERFDAIVDKVSKGRRVWVAASIHRILVGDAGATSNGLSIIADDVQVRDE